MCNADIWYETISKSNLYVSPRIKWEFAQWIDRAIDRYEDVADRIAWLHRNVYNDLDTLPAMAFFIGHYLNNVNPIMFPVFRIKLGILCREVYAHFEHPAIEAEYLARNASE